MVHMLRHEWDMQLAFRMCLACGVGKEKGTKQLGFPAIGRQDHFFPTLPQILRANSGKILHR